MVLRLIMLYHDCRGDGARREISGSNFHISAPHAEDIGNKRKGKNTNTRFHLLKLQLRVFQTASWRGGEYMEKAGTGTGEKETGGREGRKKGKGRIGKKGDTPNGDF